MASRSARTRRRAIARGCAKRFTARSGTSPRIDFLIGRLREGELDAETRAILRLGLYQLFHMRAPSHAVVNETVELAGRTRGLINAILRRALREKDSLDRALASAPDEVRLAHPAFLIRRWENQFGREARSRSAR
jgi:16S rRNA (cytosine967-C5)-methyltransferase